MLPGDIASARACDAVARRADDAPTADLAARAVLAQLCAKGGWDAARLELRNEEERRPIWHIQRRRPLDAFRAAAEERRHAPSFLDEALRGETGWKRIPRPAGDSFLFPLLAQGRLIGALEAFGPAHLTDAARELTLSICAAAAPVLGRKPAEGSLLARGLADPLTGLAARPLFMQRLVAAVERARRSPGSAPALILLSLDRFKVVNEGLGHAAGDELLRGIARRIREALRPGALAARLAADEFAVLLERIHDPGLAIRTAERLQRALDQPFKVAGREVYATASVGVAFGGQETARAEDLLRDADTAAHRAKTNGVGGRALFEKSMHASAIAQLTLESDLRRAIDTGQLTVHYQPMVTLATGTAVGFEALARWFHPEVGAIPPVRFIPAAERAGLICRLGNAVLREACAGMRILQMRVPQPLSMSVNLSAVQLYDPALVDDVAQVLESSGVDPSRLRLEVTESMLVDRIEAAAAVLQRLRRLNVQICMDDFGTGYSSLSALHRLPIDVIKVDRSFISALAEGGKPEGIVAAIVELARNLGLELVAEGVETEAQAVILGRLGVQLAQGYHFARPAALQECSAALRLPDTG